MSELLKIAISMAALYLLVISSRWIVLILELVHWKLEGLSFRFWVRNVYRCSCGRQPKMEVKESLEFGVLHRTECPATRDFEF